MIENLRIEFWRNQNKWPRDNSSHVFLARAVHKLGECLFGDEWTEKDAQIEMMPALPEDNVDDLSVRLRVAMILRSPWLFPNESGTIKKTAVPARSFLRIMPPPVNDHEWAAARSIVAKDHADKLPGLKRFTSVREKIVELADAGKLVTAIRARAGGDFTPLPSWWWNSERILNRFDLCQLNPADPFGAASTGDGYWWIFVTLQSLEIQLSALAHPARQSSNVEAQCAKWLDIQFSRPETDRWSKAKFKSAANEKFGTALGTRMFDRVWSKEVGKPRNEHRRQAGAKRKYT
jgi:hypothetical protein